MARYSIDGQILTDIADAVRGQVGETKTLYNQPAIYDYTYTNFSGTSQYAVTYTVPGASSVIVRNISSDIDVEAAKITSSDVRVASGVYTSYYDMPSTYHFSLRDDTDPFPTEDLIFYNTNMISFGRGQEGGSMYWTSMTVSATLIGLDENGEVLMNKTEVVWNAFTPEQMPDEISDMPIVPSEALHLTEDCSNKFYAGGQDWLINTYGDRMSTNNLTYASSMFEGSTVKSIPFELNFSGSGNMLNSLFKQCRSLTEIPKINNAKPTATMGDMFQYCQKLRYLPEDIETWFDWSNIDTATSSSSAYRGRNTFSGCFSLRSVPMGFLNHNNPHTTSSTYNLFYGLFQNCYCLDEVVGLPLARVGEKAWTSNMFGNIFTGCYRLKNMTFATNEDGSPIVADWKSQTIDLGAYIGYLPSGQTQYITDYNSGITSDKGVWDKATYQARKDDPDWYTAYETYSRYNHDSAVATINSLPDTSAYLATAGGTNTIKFKGAAGSATDGGAINTLTAEEIAVATAKGWTVSLV